MIRGLKGHAPFIVAYAILVAGGLLIGLMTYTSGIATESALAGLALLVACAGVAATIHTYVAIRISDRELEVAVIVLASISKRQIVKVLLRKGPKYISELSRITGLSNATVKFHSDELESENILSTSAFFFNGNKLVRNVSVRGDVEAILRRIESKL